MEAPSPYQHENENGDGVLSPLISVQGEAAPAVSPEQRTGFCKTLFNMVNLLTGIGILSTPYAVARGGWLSLLDFLLVTCICYYTGLLLKRCMEVNAGIKNYPDIGYAAFGRKGRTIITLLINLDLYLVSCELLILEGDNLAKLFPNASLTILNHHIGGEKLFVLVTALLILPSLCLGSLDKLSYVSAGGALASIVIVAAVFSVGAFEGVGFHERGILFNWKGIPHATSIFAFCYAAHAVFPTIYSSMKQKKQFPMMLLISFFLCALTYGSMAIIGYLMYGGDVESQVTLNLPTKKIGSKIAIYTTLATPITKYALFVVPISEAIQLRSTATNLLFRIMILISTVIIALTVPLFADIMELTGSLFSISASMITPPVCYLKISRSSCRRHWSEIVIIVVILLMGIVLAIVGTYLSLVKIIKKLASSSSP